MGSIRRRRHWVYIAQELGDAFQNVVPDFYDFVVISCHDVDCVMLKNTTTLAHEEVRMNRDIYMGGHT